MPESYCCNYCQLNIPNIIEYCDHINNHNIEFEYFNISKEILEYLIQWNIEPCQEILDNEIGNDGDVIYMAITEIDHEMIALDLLNLIDPTNVEYTVETDDYDRLKEYLFNKGILSDINCNLSEISDKYSPEEWEEWCHFTNNDILMLCIKKCWNNFCIKLLDYNVLYNINKQNITNAYEMALKYNLNEVAEKIKNDKRFKSSRV